ncbi:MAG: M14 family zinc carboxypeptidase, partial [Candidatus Bathyarchaeota archaeon]|nr:M14 family zinc carboxypeptidase [Candidatus Bathyarchaeota archaeon]
MSTPSEFLGIEPGSDRTMVRWDRIVEYFWYLSKSSDRIIVEDKGKSTEGNPMILAYISSPENLKNREKIRKESWTISHPLDVPEKELNSIISKGKTVVGLTMSIHASEVGGTQVSPELAYEILTGEDELTRRIRENVMILLYPCANPDGQMMTTDWYRKYLGTEFEGGNMPWLYHKYAGHDNNRDALTLTQIETQIMNKTFLGEWFPQAYLDTHQMGFFGSRFFIPPNANPVDEVVD